MSNSSPSKVARVATDTMAENAKAAASATAGVLEQAKQDVASAANANAGRFQEATEAGKAQARKFVETGAVQARTMMEQGMSQTTKATETFFKASEEAADFARGNMEAFTKAGQTYASGAQDLGRQSFAMMQALTEQTIEVTRALAGAKSFKEAADLQSSYMRQAIERFVGESAKLQEAALRLTEQTSAPLAQRMTVAFERAGRVGA